MTLIHGDYSAVPQAAEFLDPPVLSKGKTEKKKAKKARDNAAEAGPSSTSGRDYSSMSPAPDGLRTGSPVPSMMKPSFSQVSEPASGTGTPTSVSDRTKVAFGFGTKRKAEENGNGPSKRR